VKAIALTGVVRTNAGFHGVQSSRALDRLGSVTHLYVGVSERRVNSQAKHIEIDMTKIADRTAFQEVMTRHFQLADGTTEFWQRLWYAFIPLPRACIITLRGWDGFEQRMPRYARRLRRMFTDYQEVVKSETLHIEYA
jgi:hypothetical protein